MSKTKKLFNKYYSEAEANIDNSEYKYNKTKNYLTQINQIVQDVVDKEYNIESIDAADKFGQLHGILKSMKEYELF